MMKILRYPDWFVEELCWSCGEILLIEVEDIQKRIGDCDSEIFYTNCCNCGAELLIHKTKIFSEIINKI